MTLNDIRRYTVRQQCEVRFRMANGMDCVVDPSGVARVPSLRAVPDFNIESEFAAAAEFAVASPGGPAKRFTRHDLAQVAASNKPGASAQTHDEDD
ncbi:MAG: hypothetical protein R2729_28310 [Bryobacteraceae bacterium]